VPQELHTPLIRTVALVSARKPADGSTMIGGSEYELLLLPLESDGPTTLVAVLGRSLDDALAPSRRLGTLLVVLLAGSVAASVLGSVLIARGVTRPLSRLSDITRRIEEGDYAASAQVAGPEEVRELSRRFDMMREAIAAREAQVVRLAYRDPLTDLPNRVLFNDRLRTAVEGGRRSGAPLSVLLMDLDRFKYINDKLGHHVGDLVLQQVAHRVDELVRRSDTTARLGGDEFAVLLMNTGVEEARGVAAKIVAALEAPIEVGDQSLDVRASIGVAAFPAHGEDADMLLRRADAAMYAAKRGNSGVAVYNPYLHDQREEDLSLLSALRNAIDHNELRLVYQPKLDLSTDTVTGVEALLRWEHPVRGRIGPDAFVPFAEQTGFIRTITAWVIETAVKQAAAWREQGREMKVSLNISAQDLLNPDLGDLISAALKRHDLPANRLMLEVTESGVMQDASRAIEVMKRMGARGVGRSIDDFGTGYSSLTYVKHLPVDELKIDRSFVRNIVVDTKDRAIVLATIDLAHSLGLIVVAEGVEDERASDLLMHLGCDQIQGFIVARPMEAATLEGWLNERLAA